MHIVIVNDFGETNGGAAKVAIASARGLADAGVRVTFLCAIPPISALLAHPLITVSCLDMPEVWDKGATLGAALQGIWNRKAAIALAKILSRASPLDTVVHYHQWTKALSPSVIGISGKLGFPTAVSLHDYFFACPTGAYYNYQKERPCTLKPLSLRCIGSSCDRLSRAHKAVRVMRQFSTRGAAWQHKDGFTFIHVTDFARRVIARFLPPGCRHVTVLNPIPVDHRPPADVAANRDFMYVGRFTSEKGVRMLADVTRRADLPISFVGTGALEGEIRALNPNAKILGWVDEAEVQTLMRKARALVFPSTWLEVGGMVVSEALANGVPAIVSNRTAAAELVAEGVTGVTFDPFDDQALISCLLRLTDDDLATRLGAMAHRRYWEAPQTMDAHLKGLIAVYQSMVRRTTIEEPAALEAL